MSLYEDFGSISVSNLLLKSGENPSLLDILPSFISYALFDSFSTLYANDRILNKEYDFIIDLNKDFNFDISLLINKLNSMSMVNLFEEIIQETERRILLAYQISDK